MIKTRQTTAGEEKLFLAKARDFKEAMEKILPSNPNAATVLAVNCVISSCDALTAARLKQVCRDEHKRVVELIGKISEVTTETKKQVTIVLSSKSDAEYETRMTRPEEAKKAVSQAKKFFEWVVLRI